MRRLAGPGLGGMVVNVALTKIAGRSPPCQAALSSTTVGGGRGWTGQRRLLWGPSDERPQPQPLLLRLLTITIIGRRAGVTSTTISVASLRWREEEGGGRIVVGTGTMIIEAAVDKLCIVVVAAALLSSRVFSPPLAPPLVIGEATTTPPTSATATNGRPS